MLELDNVKVVKASRKEVGQEGVSGILRKLAERHTEHTTSIYTSTEDGYLFVLIPKK